MLLIPTFFCPKAWAEMSGTESQRFCTYCKKHVHNLETLSTKERMALLASPAASICSRYQIAIRRPAPGQEEPYKRHLLRYGAGVAVAGATLLVLWEMHGRNEKDRYYRSGDFTNRSRQMSQYLFTERRGMILGEIGPVSAIETDGSTSEDIIDFDPQEIDRLLAQPKEPLK
jgi:hypothetical protein